jgi:hypothetical protein
VRLARRVLDPARAGALVALLHAPSMRRCAESALASPA